MNGCNNCAKRRDITKECPWGGTYNHRGEHGEHIGICNAYSQETNADRIRGMSDEELAEYLYEYFWGRVSASPNRKKKLLDWLRQPAPEEGEHG